jgi:hypothetical protein
MALTFWKSKYWTRCGVALGAFAAGLFTAGPIFHLNEVRADSNRVFELRIYHALPASCRRWSHGFATPRQSCL